MDDDKRLPGQPGQGPGPLPQLPTPPVSATPGATELGSLAAAHQADAPKEVTEPLSPIAAGAAGPKNTEDMKTAENSQPAGQPPQDSARSGQENLSDPQMPSPLPSHDPKNPNNKTIKLPVPTSVLPAILIGLLVLLLIIAIAAYALLRQA